MRDLQHKYESPASINRSQQMADKALSEADQDNGIRSENPFTQAELDQEWDAFAEKLKESSPHIYSTLKISRPVLGENWTISLTLENKVLDDELTTHKPGLMEHLRTRLNNALIRLQTSVAEVQKAHKPYTDREKFERMAEKNPNLRNLRETFDLEFEY